MGVSFLELIPSKYAENVQTTQYTASNCRTYIDTFVATNNNAANQSISVHLIQSGGSAGNNNLIVNLRQIAPGESYTFPELVGQILADGSIISTYATAASAITIRCSGREITT